MWFAEPCLPNKDEMKGSEKQIRELRATKGQAVESPQVGWGHVPGSEAHMPIVVGARVFLSE